MRRGREQWQECVCQSAGRAENTYGMPMACVFVTGAAIIGAATVIV
jgi:hypothetical protein